jgi:molybdenum cofactor guanylyltransferase
MGRDKALLEWGGRPLLDRMAGLVKAACGDAAVVAPHGRYEHLGWRIVPDRFPGQGPLGGILTALGDTRSEWNLITACDLPRLDAGFLNELCSAAQAARAPVLVPECEGRLQPLCAVWRREALGGVEAAFASGVLAVRAALEGLPGVQRWKVEGAWFHNVNTPEEWAAYERC